MKPQSLKRNYQDMIYNRLIDEERKHGKHLDWKLIAAAKLNAEIQEKEKAACEWYIEELSFKLLLGDAGKEIDEKHWKLIVDKLEEAFENVYKEKLSGRE